MRKFLKRLYSSKSGAIIIMFALLLPILVGALGIGVEVAMWYKDKRELQNLADISAVAAAYAIQNRELTATVDGLSEDTDPDRFNAIMAEIEIPNADDNNYDATKDTYIDLQFPPGYVSGSDPSDGPGFTCDANTHGWDEWKCVRGAVMVEMEREVTNLFVGLITGQDTYTVRAMAIADSGYWTGGSTENCIVALGDDGDGIEISGSATAIYSGCNIASNADVDGSLSLGGAGFLEVECYTAVGGVVGEEDITDDEDCIPRVPGDVTDDPYEELSIDAITNYDETSCTQNMVVTDVAGDPILDVDGNTTPISASGSTIKLGWDSTVAGGVNLLDASSTGVLGTVAQNWTATTTEPYVLCAPAGETVTLQGNIEFAPGIYVIQNDLQINSTANIIGDDVTFVLANGARFNKINGGAEVQLSAPDADVGDLAHLALDGSGDFTGILFYQYLDADDPCYHNSSNSCTNAINGTSEMSIEGAVYIPDAPLSYSGNAELDDDGDANCVQIIAYSVAFSGNSTAFSDNTECAGAGVVSNEVFFTAAVSLVH